MGKVRSESNRDRRQPRTRGHASVAAQRPYAQGRAVVPHLLQRGHRLPTPTLSLALALTLTLTLILTRILTLTLTLNLTLTLTLTLPRIQVGMHDFRARTQEAAFGLKP